jgi:DNA invertase Pin-like site-specific DNA recombinase
MKGLKVGYIRVSSIDQNTDRQLENVVLDKTFVDRLSGKDTNRAQYQAMLEFVREGDCLVVHSMDRLARNLDDLRKVVQQLVKKGVQVQFVKENLTFTGDDSPMSMFTLSIMGAFAEFERSIIRERQKEGIVLAKKRGAYKGRKQTLTKPQIEELKERARRGESKASIGEWFHISRQAVYKYLSRNQDSPEPLEA